MDFDEIWLVRHGESTANIAAAVADAQGDEVIAVDHRDADVPLSPLGERQAAALGDELSARIAAPGRPVRVLVSPYRRARETLRIAAGRADIDTSAMTVDERLRDRELGVLDRLTRAGVRARHPDEEERRQWLGKYYHRPAGGESWADVLLRLRSVFRDVGGMEAGGPGVGGPSILLVVTHDAVVMLTLALQLGWDEEQLLAFAADHTVANASLTRLRRRDPGGAWDLAEFSAVEHIDDEDVTEHAGDQEAMQP